MKELSIEKRIQILEDKEAIKDITYQYALFINQGWNKMVINPNALSTVFTEDAVWKSSSMNIYEEGIENIIKSLKIETEAVIFAMHSYSNPIIKIEGNAAKGNWLFWVASKMEEKNTNQVFMSQDIQYVKIKKSWRIKYVNLHYGDIVKHKVQD